MLESLREAQGRVFRPVARKLVQWGFTPDAITWTGTILVFFVALIFFPRGWLWQGALVIAVATTCDMIDGHMARLLPQRDQRWGNVLDASLDRFADAAIFAGLAWYFAIEDRLAWAMLAIAALVLAQASSYVKARGEAVGAQVRSGVVARADRIVLTLLGALLAGLGVPWALEIVMVLLTLGGAATVEQRMREVYFQLRETGTTFTDPDA